MGYIQTKGFNIKAAGTTKNMCLSNVRKGYGIGPKYDDAWTAWTKTQQHKDRNIPTGIAVPLYYSYTATIGGIRKNYGHINVRLADGRVWSDGEYFANLEAYERARAPIYVGWGESVNDVRVIQYVADTEYIFLKPHVDKWRFYKLGVAPKKGNEFAFLNPKKFGGLEYKILGREDGGKTAIIQTENFGKGKVFIDGDAEIRRR